MPDLLQSFMMGWETSFPSKARETGKILEHNV